jgi:hypothetical protein
MIRVCQAAPFYFAYTLTNNLQLDILNRWEEKLCFANTHIQSLRFKCPDARSQLCHTHPHNNTCRRTLHTCTAQLHTRTAHRQLTEPEEEGSSSLGSRYQLWAVLVHLGQGGGTEGHWVSVQGNSTVKRGIQASSFSLREEQ